MRDKLHRAQTMADTLQEVLRRAIHEGRDRKLRVTLQNLDMLNLEVISVLRVLEEDMQPTARKAPPVNGHDG